MFHFRDRILHIEDRDLALEEGLLPGNLAKGNVRQLFCILAYHAGLSEKQVNAIFMILTSGPDIVAALVDSSFLYERIKLNYWQAYQTRLRKFSQT